MLVFILDGTLIIWGVPCRTWLSLALLGASCLIAAQLRGPVSSRNSRPCLEG